MLHLEDCLVWFNFNENIILSLVIGRSLTIHYGKYGLHIKIAQNIVTTLAPATYFWMELVLLKQGDKNAIIGGNWRISFLCGFVRWRDTTKHYFKIGILIHHFISVLHEWEKFNSGSLDQTLGSYKTQDWFLFSMLCLIYLLKFLIYQHLESVLFSFWECVFDRSFEIPRCLLNKRPLSMVFVC